MDQHRTQHSEDGVPDWVLLVLVAAAQTISVSLIIALGAPSVGYTGFGAYLFAGFFGAVLLARWIAPVPVLLSTILAIFTYYALDFPPIGAVTPAVCALYAAARRDRLWESAASGVVLLGVSAFFRIAAGEESSAVLAYDLLTNASLAACAIALAMVVTSRHRLAAQQDRIVDLERTQERERIEHIMQGERLRIARDLHDTVGHALAVIAVHANVARESLERDDNAATQSLVAVTDATSTSLGELRSTVSMLRSPITSSSPATGRVPLTLSGIEATVAAAQDAGFTVRLDIDDGLPLPGTIAAATHRIVQESITNTLKHSDATTISITATRRSRQYELTVADDGTTHPASPPTQSCGRGIAGMLERTTLLGGTLTARGTTHGFVVRARFALSASDESDTP